MKGPDLEKWKEYFSFQISSVIEGLDRLDLRGKGWKIKNLPWETRYWRACDYEICFRELRASTRWNC